jgi:hypothetical protein
MDDFVHQGSLAVVNVRDDRDIPNILHGILKSGCKGRKKIWFQAA